MNTENTIMDAGSFPVYSHSGNYMQAVSQYPVLTAEEEHELAVEYREHGNKDAAWALVCSHLRQVVGIARGYSGYGLPEMELIQEGNVGLMKAVKHFDPDKQVRLSTYATFWIKAAINEFVIRNWKIVKVATTAAQRKLFFNLRRMTRKLGKRLSIKDADKIADELDVRTQDVIEMEKRMTTGVVPFESDPTEDDDSPDYSPSATMSVDEGQHAGVLVVDEDFSKNKIEALREAIESLPEREQEIIKSRVLTESGKDTKLADLAEKFGISSERVRQLEQSALTKITRQVKAAFASPA